MADVCRPSRAAELGSAADSMSTSMSIASAAAIALGIAACGNHGERKRLIVGIWGRLI